MALTAAQAETIVHALAGAFERHDLAGLAAADAGVAVALDGDETTAAYAVRLVRVADQQERLSRLILAALRARPENYELSQLVMGALGALFFTEKKTPVL